MTIEFTNTNGQHISFGSPASLDNINPKTIIWRAYIDGYGGAGIGTHISKIGAGSNNGWEAWNTTPGVMNFTSSFSVAGGSWNTDNNVYVLSSWVCFGVSYDNSNVANDAILYVDGGSVAVNEIVAPNGVIESDAASNLYIGNSPANTAWFMDGKLAVPFIYNRILTATEHKIMADSRLQRIITDGLVFAPNLDGAAGLSVFDDVALAAANTLIDPISGAVGTPTLNPVGRGNTITNLGIGVQ